MSDTIKEFRIQFNISEHKLFSEVYPVIYALSKSSVITSGTYYPKLINRLSCFQPSTPNSSIYCQLAFRHPKVNIIRDRKLCNVSIFFFLYIDAEISLFRVIDREN